MSNSSGNAYGLTVLSPIKNGMIGESSYVSKTRRVIQQLALAENSPMAKFPQTYLCRFFIINDVFYQGTPYKEEHLKSKYLCWSTNFHGKRNEYLENMWQAISSDVKKIWQHCVAFDEVDSAADFVKYIKKCQLNISLFFNGSNDEELEVQLKALYLRQEFTKFAAKSQGLGAADLQQAFNKFIGNTQPSDLSQPTWVPGQQQLASA
ncbi:MAG: hypothetical protein V3T17_09930 [Pseudomonadales bacterium]